MRYRVIATYGPNKREDFVSTYGVDNVVHQALTVARLNASALRAGPLGKAVWRYGRIEVIDENLNRTTIRDLQLRAVEDVDGI